MNTQETDAKAMSEALEGLTEPLDSKAESLKQHERERALWQARREAEIKKLGGYVRKWNLSRGEYYI